MRPTPSPIQLFLELTTLCNLRCIHCYVSASTEHVQQLESSTVHTIIRDFHSMGGSFVSLSGGEPTLHPGWKAAMRYARYLGLDVTLVTNATRISKSDIRFLRDMNARLALSLDGVSAEVHDAIRGQQVFQRAIASARGFVQTGLGQQLTLCFTPMASNWRELPGIVALADNIGAGCVYVSLLEDRGRAASRIGELALSQEAKQSLLYSLYSLQTRYPQIEIKCPNLRFFTERLQGIEIDADALDRTIRVTANGELYLTAYLDGPEFLLGSYREGRLEEIWYSEQVACAFQAAEERRSQIPDCQNCKAWHWCRGGCATLAWAVNSNFYGVDGYCLAKQAIVNELLGTVRE
jgi:radical SAM protein with 4Fe4S-binding SPASM domain